MVGRCTVVLAVWLGLWACAPLAKRDDPRADAGDAGTTTDADSADAWYPFPHLWLAWIEELEGKSELRVVDLGRDPESPQTLVVGAVGLDWSRDRRWLVVNKSADASVLVSFADQLPGAQVALSLEGQPLSACAFSSNSQNLLCQVGPSSLAVVDVSAAEPNARAVEGAGTPLDFVAWSPDGRFALTVDSIGGAFDTRLVDTAGNPSVMQLSADVSRVRVSHDSRYLAYTGGSTKPGTWLLDLTTLAVSLVSPEENTGFEWIRGGPALAYHDAEGLHAFVPDSGASLSIGPVDVTFFDAGPDGTRLVYAGADGKNVLLDTTSLPVKQSGSVAEGKPFCWSPSDRYVGLSHSEGVESAFRVQDLAGAAPAVDLDTGELQGSATWCSFVDEALLTFARSLGWWLFYAETDSLVPVWIPNASSPWGLAWSNDRSHFAYESTGGSLEAAFRQPALAPFVVSAGPIGSFAFQP